MKLFRTAFVPLLLCGIILALGFFSPALFSALTPDHKDQTERVAIAGKENPLYLEGDTEIALPPWDVIGGQGVPLREYSDEVRPELNSHISALLGLFDCAPDQTEDFADAMYVCDGRLLYLRGYPFSSTDRYTLDLVLEYDSMFPIYLHVRSSAQDTAPAEFPASLLSCFREAANIWTGSFIRHYTADTAYTQDTLYEEIAQNAAKDAYMQEDEEVLAFVNFFNAVALQFDGLTAAAPEEAEIVFDSAILWNALLADMQDCYTLTYENETVIVLTDYSNIPCTLYYDAAQNRVTGFGIDAARFGYTAEATPRPIETP